ncbi:Pre-mRNA-splicing factor Cwf15/Cwc15 [Dipodascopsis tothii]|uniref:Pre-mRNA-splicing factor Cwf15/Cwc15 n=1 Tax=Dipodascopsis tothii TaxID=44089 RepID=UPI0034D003E9
MTTAGRPTFDAAHGKSAQAPTRIYHSRMLPAHTQLKFRKRGQGGDADKDTSITGDRELMKAELLAKEAVHLRKIKGDQPDEPQQLLTAGDDEAAAKRRKLIMAEAARADESDGASGSDDESDSASASDAGSDDESDEEDETAELMRELDRIKRERAAEAERAEREREEREQLEREQEAAMGNPLLRPDAESFAVKRQWNDDVIFKNQARGLDDKPKQGFINDMLRSEFHRKFMNKYVR